MTIAVGDRVATESLPPEIATPRVGDRVRIERDEVRYPSKGTWPRFRGKTGTVVEINDGPGGPTEYGVIFRTAPAGPWRKWWSGGEATWFTLHEITPLAAQRLPERCKSLTHTETTREVQETAA